MVHLNGDAFVLREVVATMELRMSNPTERYLVCARMDAEIDHRTLVQYVFRVIVIIQHPRLGMLRIPRCGAARGAACLVRPKITVIIHPKCKHLVV